jgi:hypothetical protein
MELYSILMIEPVAFHYNAETAVNNHFQTNANIGDPQLQALQEFKMLLEKLRNCGIDVHCIPDTFEPMTPDSIFPNNWISFHDRKSMVLFPMFAVNRRLERKHTVLAYIEKNDCITVKETFDLTRFEMENRFLEGTGSMVLDRVNRIAFANICVRTDEVVLDEFCANLNYRKFTFKAIDRHGKDIYHCNVMMCVADRYVVICMESIANIADKDMIRRLFQDQKKTVVEIDFDQMEHFCGNMLQVTASTVGANGVAPKFLVMSTQAYHALRPDQIEVLTSFNEIIHSPLYTIETLGGGSARCMMAEIC